MKKLITLLLTALLAAMICPTVFAENDSEEFDRLKQRIDSSLNSALDEETAEELDEMGLAPSDSESLLKLDMRSFLSHTADKLRDSLTQPLVMLGRILAVSLIYCAMQLICTDENSLSESFGTVSIICVMTLMADSLSSAYEALKDSIDAINSFMITYIPVYTAVTTAGGYAASAGVYSASTIVVCETTEIISSKLLIPLLSAVTALTMISAIDPKIKVSGFAGSISKLTTWLLATVMLIFVGLLSIQGATGGAADNLAAKTLRFAASSFIPVIGGSVSDAFTAVRGGMGVIRAAVGGFGVIAVFLTALRPFLLLISMKLTLWAGRIINELLGLQRTADFLKSINSVLSICTSVLITITSAFIIATAAMAALAGGH